MISLLMKLFLNSQPKLHFDPHEVVTFDKLIAEIHEGKPLTGEIPFSKYRFLQYLALQDEFIFHGSNNKTLEILEPRKQTLFNSQPTEAVFASTEPMWSVFYAVFDRSKAVGSFRNGCLVYKNRKYHYYALNKSIADQRPWTSGMIYILPKSKFTKVDNRKISFDEWVCYESVKPIGQLEVSLEDFYFKNKVTIFKENESFINTLLFNKMRTKAMGSR